MIRHIFFKELQMALLDRRLSVSCIVLSLLMVVGGLVFEKRYHSMQREYEESLVQDRQDLNAGISKKQKEVDDALQRGFTVPREVIDEYLKFRLNDLPFITRNIRKEPSKLSFIASHNSALPDGLEMDYFRMSIPQTYSAFNRYLRPFVALDWVGIILYFLSFVCLCFAYNAFSGEKQQGTLQLMLASSVPRWKILLGKLFALWCILLAPVIVGVIAHLLIIRLSADMTLLPSDYYKIAVFLLITLLFTGINILLFFAVSILTPRASVSSIVCLLVWIVLVVILPNTGWLIAGKLQPVPSITEQNLREETLLKDADDKTIRWSSVWSRQWEEHSEDVYRWKNKHDRMENIRGEIWEEYRNSLFRQTDMGIALSKISPFSVFRWTGDRIADNNYYGYRNFQQQAIAYQTAYRNYIVDRDAADPQSRHLIWRDQWNGCKEYMSKAALDPADVPVFAYRSPDVSALLYNSRMDIVQLLLWLGGLFGLVYCAFARYDVR
ncbi:MAG: ABC transporter permease [Bacteroidales bacterium]|jgi:ABC-type transport system involved in multi-copper enzyme maturation permease subunit|nr:ABC transporter permease [Bacteroidales bacterium]